jgi:hypothetical protein
MTEITSIDRIKREAHQAVKTYHTLNDACPYPFGSDAGKIFKEYFLQAQSECLNRVALMRKALRHAKGCILLDRTALADAHMNPITNSIVDEEARDALAEYDQTLALIGQALDD